MDQNSNLHSKGCISSAHGRESKLAAVCSSSAVLCRKWASALISAKDWDDGKRKPVLNSIKYAFSSFFSLIQLGFSKVICKYSEIKEITVDMLLKSLEFEGLAVRKSNRKSRENHAVYLFL